MLAGNKLPAHSLSQAHAQRVLGPNQILKYHSQRLVRPKKAADRDLLQPKTRLSLRLLMRHGD